MTERTYKKPLKHCKEECRLLNFVIDKDTKEKKEYCVYYGDKFKSPCDKTKPKERKDG